MVMQLIISPAKFYAQTTGNDTTKVFELSLEQLLNSEVTTVSKSAEKQTDAPGVITVVTKDEINRFGGTTLSSILARVPGLVATMSYVNDVSVISARGEQITNTSSHVLLLINGRPVREILEGGISSEIFETFPVNIIERIEVIKGPGSVLYGSNAFSGVINIITEKPEKTGVSISGLAGPGGALGASGDIKIKAGDFNLIAAGRYFQKPEWTVTYTLPLPPPPTKVFTRDVTIPSEGPGAYLGANFKGLSFMTSYNQLKSTGFADRGTGNNLWKKNFYNFGYDLDVSKIWRTNINLTYTLSKLDADSFPKIHRNSYEMLAEWTNFITVSKKSKIVFGGLYLDTKGKEYSLLTGSEVVSCDAKRGAYGVYAQADYLVLKSVKVIGGVQLNKIENVNMGITPRAGIIWNPTNRINVKALYSQAFRAPSLDEVSLVFPTLQGNPDLKPEKVGTYDFSVSYHGEQMQVALTYFYSKLFDVIKQNKTFTPAKYDNLGEAIMQGVELEGKYYINKSIFVTASTLFRSIDDTSGNKNICPIASIGAKGGISYASENGITIGLFDIFQGPLHDRYKTTLNVSPEKNYNLLNLYGNFDLNKLFAIQLKQTFAIFIQVDNLLDKKIWLPNRGVAAGKSEPYNQGRIMYAGLNFSF
jgi:outer membrane receptor for ferrienterochelin and colicin